MLNLLARGLSPLTRGKQAASATSGGGLPVHPRSRRKNLSTRFVEWLMGGSSPLTRGKRGCRGHLDYRDGIIPAHAGKTSGSRCSTAASRAHPHSRGENTSPAGATGLSQGSSPLTRGKHGLRASVRENAGLIPAHAGKTFPLSSCARSGGAHPHSRGENAGTTQRPPPLSGSSPLTRGVLHGCRDRTPRVGLIPTHAGKTLRRR